MKKTALAIALGVIVVCISALLGFAASAETYTGWVMDQKCAKAGKTPNAECAKKCIESGEPMVLVTDDKNLLTVANPKVLQDHIGHHVKVQGTVENNKITVTTAEAMPDKAGQ